MSTFKIEKTVPIPKTSGKGGGIYPFATMEVGDSFLIPDGSKNINSVRSAVTQAARRNGRKFTTRLTDSGLRVWRIE
jgi:hypothetical protein